MLRFQSTAPWAADALSVFSSLQGADLGASGSGPPESGVPATSLIRSAILFVSCRRPESHLVAFPLVDTHSFGKPRNEVGRCATRRDPIVGSRVGFLSEPFASDYPAPATAASRIPLRDIPSCSLSSLSPELVLRRRPASSMPHRALESMRGSSCLVRHEVRLGRT